MKRLLIFRHAKAGPHDDKRDKQRDLVDRGREDSAHMGATMRGRGYVPDVVLCSSAKRTVETWNHAAPALGAKPQVEFLDSLYDASDTAILKIIQTAGKDAAVVLYIGHNPGLERIARQLTRKPKAARERRLAAAMAEKFPTAALAVFDFDIGDWADMKPSEGALADFLTPRGLQSDRSDE